MQVLFDSDIYSSTSIFDVTGQFQSFQSVVEPVRSCTCMRCSHIPPLHLHLVLYSFTILSKRLPLLIHRRWPINSSRFVIFLNAHCLRGFLPLAFACLTS
ncbi:hypothetical protein FRC15_008979 [Serendipita sp. 397]|nr:hypothetical protein FRC15_008979 [Serendipita sp. 397]